MTIRTNPEIIMRKFEEKFLIRIQEIDPGACLGLQWEVNEKGKRKVHNETYIEEVIRQLENSLGKEIRKENVPLNGKHHLELDELALLIPEQVAEFQRLMGVLNWMQLSLRMDIAVAVTSMSRYQCQPREGRMAVVMKTFGFLKKHPKRGVIICSSEPEQIGEHEMLKPDFSNIH